MAQDAKSPEAARFLAAKTREELEAGRASAREFLRKAIEHIRPPEDPAWSRQIYEAAVLEKDLPGVGASIEAHCHAAIEELTKAADACAGLEAKEYDEVAETLGLARAFVQQRIVPAATGLTGSLRVADPRSEAERGSENQATADRLAHGLGTVVSPLTHALGRLPEDQKAASGELAAAAVGFRRSLGAAASAQVKEAEAAFVTATSRANPHRPNQVRKTYLEAMAEDAGAPGSIEPSNPVRGEMLRTAKDFKMARVGFREANADAKTAWLADRGFTPREYAEGLTKIATQLSTGNRAGKRLELPELAMRIEKHCQVMTEDVNDTAMTVAMTGGATGLLAELQKSSTRMKEVRSAARALTQMIRDGRSEWLSTASAIEQKTGPVVKWLRTANDFLRNPDTKLATQVAKRRDQSVAGAAYLRALSDGTVNKRLATARDQYLLLALTGTPGNAMHRRATETLFDLLERDASKRIRDAERTSVNAAVAKSGQSMGMGPGAARSVAPRPRGMHIG